MTRAAFILLLGLLVAPFFSVASACDGIQETCPATQKQEYLWNYSDATVGQGPYSFSSPESAASAWCGALVSALNANPPPYTSYSQSSCPSSIGPGTYNRPVTGVFTVTTGCATTCNPSTDQVTYNGWVNRGEMGIIYECTNPLYPIGPDSNHLCRMSQCPKWGSAYQPAVWNPMAPQSLCMNMPDGSKCGFNFGGVSGSTPLYLSTGEGCECSEAMQQMGACGTYQNQPPTDDNGCALMSDGVRACPADPAERCSVAGTANGEPVTVCDQGCGYFGAGDSADQFMCLEQDPPEACTDGDTRPQCQNQNPGDCPQGADTCDMPEFPPCSEGDTRPECAGLNPGDCPPGKDCSTSGVDDDSSTQGINRRLDQSNENTKGMLDILRKWDNSKHTEEQATGPAAAGNSVYDEKLQEAEGEFSAVGEGEKDSALADIAGNQGGFVAAIESMLPQPAGCSPMQISMPGYSYTWQWCDILDIFRLIGEWLVMLLVGAYIWNDIREQGKRTV